MLTARRPGVALAPPPALPGAALAAVGVVALAAEQGGYFPPAWRFGAVAFAAAAGLLWLWAPERRPGWELAAPALLAGLGLWSLLSTAWSVLPSATTLDAQRTLLYLTAALAFAVASGGLPVGVVAGATVVAGWALGGRLLNGAPWDTYEGRLLTGPIGYANGLGALCAIGAAVAVALALRHRRPLYAAPLVVLLPALALTGSRGADAALVVGLAVATGRRRLQVLAVAGSMLLLTALLVFTPDGVGDRAAYWRAARHAGLAHPLLGTGAGTFAIDYSGNPPARDAHSLYLQAFAELGGVGLLLVGALVAVPLLVALRRRLTVPGAGLAVYLVTAGVDWDWQLPVVTVAALALAASLRLSDP
ncbi:MAG TPA: O-antigen ligase family protein [Gaiellaceae bacterium]|nr:O-antigen ligase family protein [Gaiellaceae bacterium]